MLECKDEPCLLHEPESSGDCCTGRSSGVAGHGSSACARDTRGFASPRRDATADNNPLAETMSGKHRRGAPAMFRGTAHHAELSSPASAVLCSCSGQTNGNIILLAVRPEMRGRGIGRQLVRLALQQQQRFVDETQTAAAAAAPESITDQKTICRAILSNSTLTPFSSAILARLEQTAEAVNHAMTPPYHQPNTAAGSGASYAQLWPARSCCERRWPFSLKQCWLDMEAGNAVAFTS